MIKLIKLILIAMFVLPTSEVLARKQPLGVTIYARPSTQPVAPPLVAVVTFGIFYDIWRRTNCAGDVLGLGGPGFDSDAPGNYLIPAIYRDECLGAQPRRYRRGYSGVVSYDPWQHQEPENGSPKRHWWE